MLRYARVAAAIVLVGIVPAARSASEFTVHIEGSKQGVFKGDCAQERLRTDICALRFHYDVMIGRAAHTGLTAGRVQHGPVVITKQVGASSPQLYQALLTSERLKTVVIEFRKTTSEGVEVVDYRIKLTDAFVVSLTQSTEKTGTELAFLEDVAFSFRTISEESVTGGTSVEDHTGF